MRLFRCLPLLAVCSLFSALPSAQAQTEFRAFWADVFHVGYKSTAEIDAMVARAVAGRYNVIMPEMMAYQDSTVGSHGAYWRSNILPRSTVVTDSFDPLAYLVEKAHAVGIEVHPWMVAFRVSTAWPPAGNSILSAHPEYLMVPSASMGTVAPVGSDYQLDPGSPDVQEYLISIVRELVTNYDIDGIHWDYIRYTQADAGYPTDTSYANSGLARFKRLTGYTGTPPATGYTPWDDFRRRTITEIIRRVRAELADLSTTKPLRHSASLITWGSAPSTFSGSSAWARFQNWEEWMRLGFLDTGIPMTYYDYSVNASMYTSWVNKEMAWRYQRQMVVGPGIYLNTFADSLAELNYARSAGADGVSTYSYWATKKSSSNDWTWYDYVAANFFTAPAGIPGMPWRDPATATEGTLWGRVINPSTSLPIDDATVQVGSLNPVKTDANGYYVVTMIPATAAGTSYSITASAAAYGPVTHNGVVVTAGEIRRDDFSNAGPPPPTITQQPVDAGDCAGGTVSFNVSAEGEGTLSYQWQKNEVNLSDGGHASGATTPILAVSGIDAADVAGYRCVVSNAGGTTTSNAAALTLKVATTVTQNPLAASVCPGGSATFNVAATGDGAVLYQWQKDGVNLIDGGHCSGTTTAALTVSSVDTSDLASYSCAVTAGCGTATSTAAALSLKSATSITQQPLPQTVDSGATVQFTVAAAGDGPFSYQWQKDGVNLSDGGHYAGVNTATLSVSPADTSDAGGYSCVVTGACGVVISEAATLTVNAAPPVITQQPVPASACLGGSAIFTVAAAGEGTLTYHWQKNGIDVVEGGHWSGTTTATLTVSMINEGDVDNYRCLVSNAVGTTASDTATLSLLADTLISGQPVAQTLCPGTTATFTVAATGEGTLAYQWQKNQTNLIDGGHYSGATTATLTVTAADAGDVASYRCLVTGGCGSAVSDEAALTLQAATVITQQPQNQTVAIGGTAMFSVAATGEGKLSYQWQKNAVNIADGGHYSGTTTATLTVSSVDANDAGSYRCVVTGACGTTTSSAATLALPAPVMYIVESRAGGQNYANYSQSGTWSTSSIKSTALGCTAGIGSRYCRINSTAKTAVFRFTPTVSGTYNVYTTNAATTNSGNPLVHQVTHAGGTTNVGVCQNSTCTPNPCNTWRLLGTFTLNAGTEYRVKLNGSTAAGSRPKNAYGRADAIKWEMP